MKIAFIVNNYPPKMGGVENHVRSLAIEIVNQGHKALVVTLGTNVGIRLDEGVEVLTFKEHLRYANILGIPALGTKKKLTKLLKENFGSVAVSTHTRFFPMSFIGLRAARKAGIPVIHTEHGSDHVKSSNQVINLLSKFIDYTIGRIVMKKADQVLVVSEEVAGFVKKLADVNATLFYNATYPSDLITNKPVLSKRFVFVGRLVTGKGWEIFLDGLKAIHNSGEQFEAFIAGDGPDLSLVRSRVEELNLESAVTVLGKISSFEVRKLLRHSLLVNPTNLSEGFQTTLLEAISEGGQVLTYPVPGAQELKRQGAPVKITLSRSPKELEDLMRASLREEWQPASQQILENWYWQKRTAEFLVIAARLIPHP